MADTLAKRFEENKTYRFQDAQTRIFLSLVQKDEYQVSCDIGCGMGYWSYLLAKYSLVKDEICGCDLRNDYRVKELQSVNQRVAIGYMDIKNNLLPFDNNKFDLVFSVDVIEHVKDDRLLFLEHLRIAKPGATILIITPNYWRFGNIILMAINRLKFPRRVGEGIYEEKVHLREYTARKLAELAKKASDMIQMDTLRIIPCWVGLPLTNIGRDRLPYFLEHFSHSLFMIFKKNN